MARQQKEKLAAVTTGSGKSSGIPRAMALRLIRDLPGEPGFLATIIALKSSAQLVASVGATEPHDFVVRVGIVRPRAQGTRDTIASTASRAPRVVTIGRNAPLSSEAGRRG